MTRTVYHTATSLDGFVATADDSLDWLLSQPLDQPDPDSPAASFDFDAFLSGVGAAVMGATTYEWVRRHLDASGGSWPYRFPSFVCTHRDLPGIEHADLRFVSGDVAAVHRRAAEAAGGREVWIVGGGDLAGQFADAGLLDELVVSIAPVTLGSGRPLFPRRRDLELVDLARHGVFACARYRPAAATA